MNVIVSNKKQEQLNSLDIDVIKSINGIYETEELVSMFKNFEVLYDNKDDIINTINHMTFEDDEKKSIINCLDAITNFQGNQIKYAEGAVDKLGKISDFYKLKNGRYVEIIYRPTLDLSVKHYSDINS